MYAYLQGKITHKSPTLVYLDVAGVGYAIHISLHTFSDIQGSTETKLWTYLHVKEDQLTIYGFSHEEEKELFILLIGVSGIGPNTARIVLSNLRPEELQAAIMQEDVATFKTVKGIGPKTAQRLIIELKDKVAKLDIQTESTDGVLKSSSSANLQVRNEAQRALVALGFNNQAVNKVLKTIDKEHADVSTEELIKLALRRLS